VNEESAHLFKAFRVLVFPMSLNAVGLGALATFLFWLATWATCAIAGDADAVGQAIGAFSPSIRHLVLTGSWPEVPWIAGHSWVFGVQLVVFYLLWSTFGVAICRILALRIARDEICTWKAAWNYAWDTKVTALLFPAAIALPVLFLVFCNGAAGWISSVPYLGWLVGLVLLPFVIVSSLLIILAVAVGLLSAGLFPGIVAVERKGTFDAIGKATNCVTARPLSMLLYLVLMYVFIVQVVHAFLIDFGFVERVLSVTLVPFGETRFEAIALGRVDALEGLASAMGWVALAVLKAYRLLVWGLLVSLTLGGFTSIFLILRQDVDGIDPMDIARDPKDMPPPPPAEAASDAAPDPETLIKPDAEEKS